MNAQVKLIPTPEQQAAIDFAVQSEANGIISALAGAAKTSTLEMIASALRNTPILCLAFNKRIAEEMKKRLPSNTKAATLNSVGHGAWAARIGKKLQLETKGKGYSILTWAIDRLPKGQVKEAYEAFAETLKIFKQTRIAGYIPPRSFAADKSLISSTDFYASLEEEPSALQIQLVDDCLIESIRQAFEGIIDFDDQIYMPTLFGGVWPKFPLVLVDEAQDLNEINHKMIQHLVTKRIIAVGDKLQSIYVFRGALSNSMDQLKETFAMQELGLSVSFRCPIKVVESARFRAPHMQWAPWAKPGVVETLESWNAKDIPDGAAIVCRNNAPLLSCALKLIQNGRGVKLVGTELGPQLVKALKKLGDESLSQEQVLQAIERWRMERLRKSRSVEITEDKAECLRVFARFGDTLGAAIAYAEHVFSAAGPVQLLTIHKAKGLEWDTVYFLDPWRIPSKYAITEEAKTQELNARYVAITRAKANLYYIDLETLED